MGKDLMQELGLKKFGEDEIKSGGTGVFTPKMNPGDKVRVRVLVNGFASPEGEGVHWVPKPGAEDDSDPIPCPGEEECKKIALYDGRMLHDIELSYRYRALIWNHNTRKVEILEQGTQVMSVFDTYFKNEEWGDLTKYDFLVKCVPAPPPFGKKYEVEVMPPKSLDDEVKKIIKETASEIVKKMKWDDSVEDAKKRVAALTSDESTPANAAEGFDSGLGAPEGNKDKGESKTEEESDGVVDWDKIL